MDFPRLKSCGFWANAALILPPDLAAQRRMPLLLSDIKMLCRYLFILFAMTDMSPFRNMLHATNVIIKDIINVQHALNIQSAKFADPSIGT